MRRIIRMIAALALVMGSVGCFYAVHEPARVELLEAEHRDPTVIVVESPPPAERNCWRHDDHWHCRVEA